MHQNALTKSLALLKVLKVIDPGFIPEYVESIHYATPL